MKRCFAQAKFVTAIQNSRLARREPDGIVNYRSVNRTQIFNQKRFSFAPDSRVSARDFGFRIEPRKINLWKNI